jgi:elongator complex protein 3
MVEEAIAKSEKDLVEIRAREIRAEEFDSENIKLKTTEYQTTTSREIFLEYVTPNDDLLGFLRLSLPKNKAWLEELQDCSIIREIHVYGQSTPLDTKEAESAQHTGLGTKLISTAKKISQQQGYKKIGVISAVGTREYYRKLNFSDGELYQTMKLI